MKNSLLKKSIVFILVCLTFKMTCQIPISDKFYGENYWMPNKIFNGRLSAFWPEIQASGVKYMRIGGKAYDQGDMWSESDLLAIIDSLRIFGIEPIVQVPIDPNQSVSANASDCADWVNRINVNNARNIVFWEIGNEPDGSYYMANNPFGDYTTNSVIADYTRQCATAMKNVQGQLGIKIIGPCLSYYDFNRYADFLGSGTNSIMGKIGSGPTDPYYIDYVGFNTYPFSQSDLQASSARQDIIDYIRDPSKFEDVLDDINSLILNAGRASNCKIMITEANISYQQDNSSSSSRGPSGVGPGSMLGGQFWAEMMAVAMEKNVELLAFWSIIEGTGWNNRLTDIGYISSETEKKRASYFHYQKMAEHFKGNFYPSVTITGSSNIKAWAARSSDRVAVMIVNQNSSGTLPFKVRLDGNSSAGGNLDIRFNINGVNNAASYVSSVDINNQSTTLLIFDCKGVFSKRYDYTMNQATMTTDPGFTVTATGTGLIGDLVSLTSFNLSQLVFDVTMQPSNYVYTWEQPGPCGVAVPVANSGVNTTLSACMGGGMTVYNYTVTNPTGCSAVKQVSVNSLGIPVGSPRYFLGVSSSTCGTNNGSASVVCNNCLIKWDSGPWVSQTNTLGLAPGPHTVVTFGNNLTDSWFFYVPIVGTRPLLSAGPDLDAGRGCPVVLCAVPDLSGHTYEWFSGNSSVPFSSVRSNTVVSWIGDTYRVRVTAPNGCFNEDVVTVRRNGVKCILPNSGYIKSVPCTSSNSSYRQAGIETDTLTESTLLTGKHYLDGKLVVPANIQLTIDSCEIAFGEGAGIEVLAGGKLVVGTTYGFPCPGMVSGTIGVLASSTNSSSIEIKNSYFEDLGAAFVFNHVKGLNISDNDFVNSALWLNQCTEFTVKTNSFQNTHVALKTTLTPSSTYSSEITGNTFHDVDTALFFKEDNHLNLSIGCNSFNYLDYAIYSMDTDLSNQGSSTSGAGNVFSSSSTLLNSRLYHSGNTMSYFCDPGATFTLQTNSSLSASTFTAAEAGNCEGSGARSNHSLLSAVIVSDELELFVFPNPSDGDVNINYNLPTNSGKSYLSVVAVGTGQKIYEEELTDSKHIIYGNVFAPGMYIISINTENSGSKNYKFISIR